MFYRVLLVSVFSLCGAGKENCSQRLPWILMGLHKVQPVISEKKEKKYTHERTIAWPEESWKKSWKVSNLFYRGVKSLQQKRT